MLKTISFCGLLLIMATGLAHADFYRCKGSDGSTIFTDNQSNIPPECQVDVVRDSPYSGGKPFVSSPSVKQRTATQRPVTSTESGQQGNVESDYDFLQGKAESLAGQFVSTRKRVFRSTKVKNKQKAKRELTEIRSQKTGLLSDVDQSTLNRAQKKEIGEILSSITE